jgi:hypothetical protein
MVIGGCPPVRVGHCQAIEKHALLIFERCMFFREIKKVVN